eukprot:scaffold42982_cov59-Phaeocystis_antarctica.AAC.1
MCTCSYGKLAHDAHRPVARGGVAVQARHEQRRLLVEGTHARERVACDVAAGGGVEEVARAACDVVELLAGAGGRGVRGRRSLLLLLLFQLLLSLLPLLLLLLLLLPGRSRS